MAWYAEPLQGAKVTTDQVSSIWKASLQKREVTQSTYHQNMQGKEKKASVPVAWEAPIILPLIKPSLFSFLTNFVVLGSWVLTYSLKSFFKSAEKKENTSSTPGEKFWKLCLKSQDI